MNRTALSLSVALTALAAFGAGYAVRGGVGGGGKTSGKVALPTKVTVREGATGSNGPGNRGGTGASAAPLPGQRAFPKGEAGKWLESLKSISNENPVAISQVREKCGAMGEEEAAELLAKCGEILALWNADDYVAAEKFPNQKIIGILAEEVAGRLAGIAPAQVLAVVKGSKELLDESDLMQTVFAVIAQRNPAQAIAEARGLEDPESAAVGIMNQLVASHDLAMADSLLQLFPGHDDLTQLFLRQAIQEDPDLAVRRGCELAVSGDEEAFKLLLNGEATRQRTVDWALAYQGPEAEKVQSRMIGTVARKDIPQAKELYLRMAPGISEEARNEAAVQIARRAFGVRALNDSWLASLDEKALQAALVNVIGAENQDRVSFRRSWNDDADTRLQLAERLFGELPASPGKRISSPPRRGS